MCKSDSDFKIMIAIKIAIKSRSGKNADQFLFFIWIAFYLQKLLRTEKNRNRVRAVNPCFLQSRCAFVPLKSV